MLKNELLRQFEDWYNQNATEVYNKNCFTEALSLGVKELYINDTVGINRSFYQYTLDADLSCDGIPKMLIYSSIDLLKLDSNGDIAEVIPIDYEIIS